MEKNLGKLPLRRACAAGGVGIALLLLLLLAGALLENRLVLPRGRAEVYGRAALFLASVCASYFACRKQREGKAVCAAISGAVILLFVIFLGIILNRSSLINMSLLLNLLCIIFGGLAGCFLTLKQKRRKKRK